MLKNGKFTVRYTEGEDLFLHELMVETGLYSFHKLAARIWAGLRWDLRATPPRYQTPPQKTR